MITFDASKLHCSYAYISKITSNYVWVLSHRNGEPFRPTTTPQHTDDRGRSISKVRISKDIYNKFVRNNSGSSFPSGRLASLNYYGDKIVSVEIQPPSPKLKGNFSSADHWQSGFSKVIQELSTKIKDPKLAAKALFNGHEVFWEPSRNSDLFYETLLDRGSSTQGSFSLRAVRFVSIGDMGLSKFRKMNERLAKLNAENHNESSELTKKINELQADEERPSMSREELIDQARASILSDIENETARLNDRAGLVLVYRPDPNNPNIEAYSPVFPFDLGRGADSEVEKKELRGLYDLFSNRHETFVSLDFVIKTCRTIGELYGPEKTEFFDVPAILQELKVTKFSQIHPESRAAYPVAKDGKACLAWLLGFGYSEKNLDSMRTLSKMTRQAITSGIISSRNIGLSYYEGAEGKEVPKVDMEEGIEKIMQRESARRAARLEARLSGKGLMDTGDEASEDFDEESFSL